MSKQTVKKIIILIPWLIILILAGLYIFRKDVIIDYVGDPNKPLYDSIAKIQEEKVELKAAYDVIAKQYDSLLSKDVDIKIKYHDKIKFIYSDASISELDSIIRSRNKGKSRH